MSHVTLKWVISQVSLLTSAVVELRLLAHAAAAYTAEASKLTAASEAAEAAVAG